MDLTLDEPTGLSALPMDLQQYQSDLASAFPDEQSIAPPADLFRIRAVRALRQTLQVDAWIYHATPSASPGAGNPVQILQVVQGVLSSIFANVRVNVALVPIPTGAQNLLPPNTDFLLLITLVSPLVEEVYRLIAYYVQSTFEWQRQGENVQENQMSLIDGVAGLINEALTGPVDPQVLLQRLGTDAGTFRIEHGGREYYSKHFWGNFDHLKGKVLQSLRRSESDVDIRLLKADDVFAALGALRGQLWRKKRMPAGPTDRQSPPTSVTIQAPKVVARDPL
jgi:hypothetical protein